MAQPNGSLLDTPRNGGAGHIQTFIHVRFGDQDSGSIHIRSLANSITQQPVPRSTIFASLEWTPAETSLVSALPASADKLTSNQAMQRPDANSHVERALGEGEGCEIGRHLVSSSCLAHVSEV